ncbi:integrator complex subunit 1 [Condylostylus longicornis]|uniref:integrator complex subunit 1 n=1 Tax=Condylostylus longicornis TaxID=2530218 RepID=UPI00244DB1A8|nr:integrator complex subunit 1 [Condylostylus longicornis]
MDRNKPGSSRSSKAKIGAPHGSELFALGTKPASSSGDKKIISSVTDRKREPTTSLVGSSVPKKTKIGGTIGNVPRLSGEGSSSSSSLEPWEQAAVECEPQDLVNSVLTAIDQQDSDTIVGLVCGAIKLIASNRNKTDNILSLSLLYLAKLRPTLFCNYVVTSALISILKRDIHNTFKGRSNPTAHILAANLLARGYHDKKTWPEVFVKTYIDDAANERLWVDICDCAPFVENICTAFKTKIPPKSLLQPEGGGGTPTSTSTNVPLPGSSNREYLVIDDDSGDNSLHGEIKTSDLECPVQDRYANNSNIVEKYVSDIIKEQLNRRQQQDCSTRNFLKFLSSTSGIPEVRSLSISRLELWIHNGKLMRPAQELLTYICYNITSHLQKDHEVLATLVKMRLKTKPLINIYMLCLKEMLLQQPDILFIALKLVVQNELSNARNPNNMGMLANMFQTKPEQSAKHLAEIYQEFLLQREDCLRTLRVFLRELVKMLRYDINLVEFCKSFLVSRPDLAPQIQQSEFKERIFLAIVEITCLCMFLTVSPQVREANVSLRAGRDMRNNPILLAFYAQMSQIQLDALTWMHQVVPILFNPQANEYTQALHRILLLDSPEQYSRCDQWPPEPERVALLRLVSETPVHEDSLLRIILIGITKEIPFSIQDTYDVIEQTIKRASALKCIDYPAVEANKVDIIDFLFSMAEYHHPENIHLPVGYEPPKLAITTLYWKAWVILLMLSSHNPSTFGAYCWEHYPILRMLMEICITNQFHDIRISEELQLSVLEKQNILEFETHLAAASSKVVITEQNSLLLSQLTWMDPMGPPRRPPNYTIDNLQQLNATYKFGHLLCRSRKPDLLLDIIQRQGTTQSMPWLIDLVQNSDGDFSHLPVQCLCEFLLANSSNMSSDNVRDVELLEYLRNFLRNENADKQTSCEVLEYFLRRLASTCKQSRIMATNALKLLLQTFKKPDDEEDPASDWLLRHLPHIPHFIHARPLIILQLRAACQIENNPELVMIYIQFIAAHTLHDPVPDMLDHVMDMSQLIVERSTIFQHIIPIQTPSTMMVGEPNENEQQNRLQTLNCLFVMFNNYIIKLRDTKPPYEWAEYPDLLMVHFDDGVQLPIHLNIIHAFVILLTHSTTTIPNSIPILDYWFPPGRPIPQAFTIETNEPVTFLPDWLKLKMIRSPVDRLVEAAMHDLTPDQIVLFVQNFGTPITSMSKLLALLDQAVIEQFQAVRNAVLNKAYLAQLIEIQRARGAKNGHITVTALELCATSSPDLPKTGIYVLESINLDQFQTILSTEKPQSSSKGSKEVDEIVDIILKNPNMTKLNNIRFRKLIHQLLGRDQISSVKRTTKPQDIQVFSSGKALLYLMRLVESPHGPYVFQNIFQKTHACTFFRALLTYVPEKVENHNFMLQVIDKIILSLSATPDLENTALLNILTNKRKTFIRHTLDAKVIQTEKQDFIQILMTEKATELECQGRKFVNDMIEHRKTENLVEALVSVLKIDSNKNEVKMEECCFDKKGILVDWLAEVDSELITVNKILQMDLLFGCTSNEFKFYMLSLLCHQANWQTLSESLKFLLSIYKKNYDCSAVLNFIDALIHNPKMWQGRDKAVPKHEQKEYILTLTMPQAKVFTEYALNESLKEIELNGESNVTNEKLSSRVTLFIKIVDEKTFEIMELVQFVRSYDCLDTLKQKFLQQIYLMLPTIKFLDDELETIYTTNAQNLVACRSDKITNFIITTFTSLQTQKDYQAMGSDSELLIRKLAASHPTLFLRQLAVLSALIQGKAHMDIQVLRTEYHVSRLHQVVRILELLQPLVFEDVYRQAFQMSLDCYFMFFKHHSRAKEAYPILLKFVELLQAYINNNPVSALAYIEQYTGLMQELSIKFRGLQALNQLVQGLSLLKHKTSTKPELNDEETSKQEFDLDEQEHKPTPPIIQLDTEEAVTSASNTTSQLDIESRGAASFALGGPHSKQAQISPHFHNLVNIIRHSSSEEVILQPLQDIESLTFKRTALLDELYERLLELIFSPSTQIRTNAYILLIRHLKHNPGKKDVNKTTLLAYIQCLKDENSAVASSAVDNLIEIVVCLQEYASEILRTVFELNVESKLNTTTQIKKCLQTLKLQHGC